MARQWILASQEGFEKSLEFQTNIAIPKPEELGPNDVLVRLHAASLNYRELVIAGPTQAMGPIKPPIVPGCDGAGVVEAVGSQVTEFKPADRVVTIAAPLVASSRGDDAESTIIDARSMLGHGSDGTLRSHGVFLASGLVHAPQSLDFPRAATLTCTWTTAWNVCFGLRGQELHPESWVLVQGTGGVSIAALQLAVAVGATVVATTSSEEKAARLKNLGAAHVINYKTSPTIWGEEARATTPHGRGFNFVLDIGGNETLPQSLAAVRTNGLVMILGQVGEASSTAVSIFSALLHTCVIRGVLAGSRNHSKKVARFIDEHGIKPEIDDVAFELEDAKEAYRRMTEKQHFSKVIINISHDKL